MNNPLRTPEDHELFLYTLTEQFPSVRRSTVTFVRLGATLTRVAGELQKAYILTTSMYLQTSTTIAPLRQR